MGTRHLTTVKYKGEKKISQYGQWDGYPDTVGLAILEVLRFIGDGTSKEAFNFYQNLQNVYFVDEEEVEKMNQLLEDSGEAALDVYPYLHRNNGGDALLEHMAGKYPDGKPFPLLDQGPSWCEYIYDIDLDERTLTVNDDHTWSLDELPTNGEFLEPFIE